ncbi:MAG: response regulator, partial [Magnetococcales bacterium]|nr:response regulator [Magnetococcales bacterium]
MKSIAHNKQSRILVVDDSRSARELIRLFLEKNGYAVTTAADGKEAVRKFREEAIDLVLMDANMPVVDGYRACAEIRRSPNGTDVSIIMITGQDDDASVEKAFDAGAEEYITKPIHWIVLQKRIDLSLNNRFAQEAVAEGRARMEAIVNTAADGIIVINQAGEIESVNVSAEKMFGYANQEMLGKNIAIIMPSPHREAHDQHLARYHASGLSTVLGVTLERLAVKKNGKTFPIELRISQVKIKDRVLFTGILRDITERKLAEEKIFYQANYDALTGIANRGVFMSTLHQTVETASRNGQTSALVFVDLDRFKWVNDTLGHAAGDELLKAS